MTFNETKIAALMVTSMALLPVSGIAHAADKSDLINGQAAQWQGFYLGAQTGWNSNRGKDKAAGTKLNSTVFDAGIHAGYNWQMDSTVLGFEVDANLLGLTKKNPKGIYTRSFFTPLATTRLRIGQTFGDSMIYGTGGLSFGIGEHKTGGQKKAKLHPGWVIGAGLEHKLNANWSLRSEYLYHNFGKKNYKFNTGTRRLSYDDTHSVRLGVSYRF